MTPALFVRRALTVTALVAALALGFVTIRIAAAWTAESAPLAVSPVSVASLQSQLDAERDRSAALSAELERLVRESTELSEALGLARSQIASESDHATALSADLEAARTKLGKLEEAIRDARAALASQRTVTVRTVATSDERDHDDDDHEDDEHDDEDDDDD